MAKLEGYSKVAVIKYHCGTYYFAIYDDGNDYEIGDMVIFSSGSTPAKIKNILTLEEAKEEYPGNITAEVAGKVDISAYENRVKKRERKEELKKELNNRKKEIQKKLDDEYYASKDEVYAEMLREYESL